MKLVIHPAVDEQRLLAIREAAGSMPVVNCQSDSDALTEIVTASAFFGKMTPELLENALGLDWVQSPTASLEHFLFPELIAHPCRLSNMRGLFSDVIADHVFAYIACIARNLHLYLRQQQDALWNPIGGEATRTSFLTGPGIVSEIDRRHRHLSDCAIGVVGVGHIGAEVCRRAHAFGMQIRGVDPQTQAVEGVLDEVWKPERLPELLAQSDFVVICAPHTPETERMFGADQFRQMRDSAWLINIGRGILVDLVDLVQALKDGVIAGAALDVFETEPLPEDHPLWGMSNVIITPHIAAASLRVAERHLETLLENIRRYVSGDDPLTLVDKSRWY